jgi:hypothetical protein
LLFIPDGDAADAGKPSTSKLARKILHTRPERATFVFSFVLLQKSAAWILAVCSTTEAPLYTHARTQCWKMMKTSETTGIQKRKGNLLNELKSELSLAPCISLSHAPTHR